MGQSYRLVCQQTSKLCNLPQAIRKAVFRRILQDVRAEGIQRQTVPVQVDIVGNENHIVTRIIMSGDIGANQQA